MHLHRSVALLLLVSLLSGVDQSPGPSGPQALVERALGNELHAAQETGHPMRYTLRKSSPRLTSTKLLIETKDGVVARLTSIDDQPLSLADEKKEQDRLDGLLGDPSRQRHRKQSEDADTARAMKVLRALPRAFLYEYAGADPLATEVPAAPVKFTFKPNPKFDPPDLETQVLTAMTGAIWIDPAQERVARLEGHLDQDVNFGWGVLGRLNKGGTIAIEQAAVSSGQWRIVRFEMKMSGRLLFKTRVFDTTEVESGFAPVSAALDYRGGIALLRAGNDEPGH